MPPTQPTRHFHWGIALFALGNRRKFCYITHAIYKTSQRYLPVVTQHYYFVSLSIKLTLVIFWIIIIPCEFFTPSDSSQYSSRCWCRYKSLWNFHTKRVWPTVFFLYPLDLKKSCFLWCYWYLSIPITGWK